MKRRLVHIVTLLLVLSLAGGCARKEVFSNQTSVAILLHLNRSALTKANLGSVESSAAEQTLSSLQVWVFRHSDGLLLDYVNPDVENFDDGDEERIYILVDNAIARNRPSVDVYAVANLASTGLLLDGTCSRDDLDAAVMSDCFFGSSASVIPVAGLPYSGVGTQDLVGNFPVLNAGSITLNRAVSKLRFVFSQIAGPDGNPLDDFQITDITLAEDLIPTQEYLFNTSGNAYRVNTAAFEEAVSFPVPTAAIPAISHPESYAYHDQNAVVYNTLIEEAIAAGNLSATPYYYFRETPRALSGTISYRIGEDPNNVGTVPFEMSQEGDFARNRSWIVYVYYSSGKIYFTVSYEPWEDGGDIPMNGDDA